MVASAAATVTIVGMAAVVIVVVVAVAALVMAVAAAGRISRYLAVAAGEAAPMVQQRHGTHTPNRLGSHRRSGGSERQQGT